MQFSKNGELMAYSYCEKDSDWKTIRIMNLTSKVDFPEVINFVKFSKPVWTHDNVGFFYGV